MTDQAKPLILSLFESWNETERRQSLLAMDLDRKVELAGALIAAGWTPRDLRAAGWTPSDLRAAGWTPSDMETVELSCKEDVQAKARKMRREEAAFVIQQLRIGMMLGSDYGKVDRCGCFLGSAARAAGKSISQFCKDSGIEQDGSSPAEQWFINVRIGDTPENCYAAEKGVEWLEEVLAESES